MKAFGQIMKIGLPAGIQSAVFAVSNIVIQSAINSLGKVVMAASSAAYNIEIFAYDVMNSFSQACTTFVGQNYGAKQIKRCKRTLALCLIEDAIATASAIILVLLAGRYMLAVFNSDPEVIDIGYTRLKMVFFAYIFSMLYDVMSGYLRGFGIFLAPAILSMRSANCMDKARIPAGSHIPYHYDRIPRQPVIYSAAHIYCAAFLSPFRKI